MGCHICQKWINTGEWKIKEGKFYHPECLTKRENCVPCNGSGIAYWSDDMYGKCFECNQR